MGVEKAKPSATRVRAEAKAVEPAKIAVSAAPADKGAAVAKGSGFEPPRKKLVNFTGRHKAHAPAPQPKSDLDALIEGSRKAAQAGLATETNKTVSHGTSTGFGKTSAAGNISAAEWADPTRLVGKLTQFPAGKPTAQSEATCAASNMLGIALLSGGPGAAGKMLQKVAAAPTQLNEAEKAELTQIAKKVTDQTATFGDLNKAQELMYRAGNTEATGKDTVEMAEQSKHLNKAEKAQVKKLMKEYLGASVMSRDPAELNRLLTKAFGTPTDFSKGSSISMDISAGRRTTDTSGLTDAELQTLGKTALNAEPLKMNSNSKAEPLAASLKPGEAVTLRIAGDGKADSAGHYVTIGRQPNGKLYIYNPDPSRGDSTLVVGGKVPDAAFLAQLNKYDSRMVDDKVETDGQVKFVTPDALKTKF